MTDLFETLFPNDIPKRERLINACLSEFAARGYKNASTNEIVKNAGISKGILFHYFGTKHQIYLKLFHYCCELTYSEFYNSFDLSNPDFIGRLYDVFLDKMALIVRHPDISRFLEAAALETDPAIHAAVTAKIAEVSSQAFARFAEGCDLSLFKEGIDIPRATAMIRWTLEGLSNRYIHSAAAGQGGLISSYPEIRIEAEEYLALFRRIFYKES